MKSKRPRAGGWSRKDERRTAHVPLFASRHSRLVTRQQIRDPKLAMRNKLEARNRKLATDHFFRPAPDTSHLILHVWHYWNR